MEFRQIRYALAVARERSFTKASERLGISQPAVSEQVRLLEARIGFNLFRRTGRGIEPTERGRMFLHEAERIATEVMSLNDIARRLSGVGVESFVIGICSGLAPVLLPRIFPRDSFPPNLQLEIKTAPTRVIFDELHDDRLDLGIAVEVEADRVPSGLSAMRLFELDVVLIVPSGHRLAAGREPVDIALLAEEPVIMNELSIGYGEIVGAMFRDHGIRPHIRAVVDNVETIKTMVQTGAGIALVPSGAAEVETISGVLEVRPVLPARRIPISVYRSRQSLSRRKEELLEQLFRPLTST